MKIKQYAVSAMFLFLSMSSSAHAHVEKLPAKKVYVDSNAISIIENGIFIKTRVRPIKVKSLRHDGQGIFVLVKESSLIAKEAASCQYCFKLFFSKSKRDEHEKNCPLNPDS